MRARSSTLALATALALALGAVHVHAAPPAEPPPAPPPAPAVAPGTTPDSLGGFLKGLSDSTDAFFGPASVDIDTTGLDSLAGQPGHPLRSPFRGARGRLRPTLLARYHRAEGPVLGAGLAVPLAGRANLGARWAYGFSNEQGRYAFEGKALLWSADPGRRVRRREGEDAPAALDLDLVYARETVPFAAEHAQAFTSTAGALFTWRDRQSVYERRGFTGRLTLHAGGWRVAAGYRDARERAMARATDFTLVGADESVPGVTVADPDDYHELLGGIGFARTDWEYAAGLEARRGGNAAWQARAAMGKALRVGRSIKAYTQAEAGATEAGSPRQRRFELGGPQAVPSLGYGTGGGDHLLLGRLELVEAHDSLKALGLPHPDILVLQASIFAHAGAVWNDPAGRSILFSRPPSAAWRGAAGVALDYRPGIPDPDTFWRFQYAWPLSEESGVARFSISVGRAFDLVPRR